MSECIANFYETAVSNVSRPVAYRSENPWYAYVLRLQIGAASKTVLDELSPTVDDQRLPGDKVASG